MAGTHRRNFDAMVEHRKALHDDAVRRTEAMVEALRSSGESITFQLVAKRAGVSRSWLYKQQGLRDRIAALRRDHPWRAHASGERASSDSKEAIIRALRQRVADERTAKAKLTDENTRLRKLNEVLAGQVHHCRTYHTTNAAMASEYSRIVYHAPPPFDGEDNDAATATLETTEWRGNSVRSPLNGQ
jgi:hypothetical protein